MLENTITVVNNLDSGMLRNGNQKNALTNKLSAVLESIDQGYYSEAITKLESDLLRKTDGCVKKGIPENNDWITDCTTQGQVYQLIEDTIIFLQRLI